LYTFPYHLPGNAIVFKHGGDYYYDLITNNLACRCDMPLAAPPNAVNSVFNRVQLHNPSMMELYNFSVGEVLEFGEAQNYPSASVTTTTLDTILSKATTSTSVSYTTASRSLTTTSSCCPVVTNSTGFSGISTGGAIDTTKLLNLSILPEEWQSPYFNHYFPKASYDVVPACPDPLCSIDVNYINYTTARVIFEYLDASGMSFIGNDTRTYSMGFGLSGTDYHDYTGGGHSKNSGYRYVKNNDSICGAFADITAVRQVNAVANQINICPNPANTFITIKAQISIDQITIINLEGQTTFTHNYNSEQVNVNVSAFPSGIYFVKVNGIEVRKFVKE